MALQREIGDQSFQFRVFFPQVPELAQLAQSETSVLPFPCVERLLGNADLPTDLHHGRPAFRLPQGGQDLFLCMSPPRAIVGPPGESRRPRCTPLPQAAVGLLFGLWVTSPCLPMQLSRGHYCAPSPSNITGTVCTKIFISSQNDNRLT